MEPGLGALDVMLAAASETAMVLCPLRREDVLTVAAAAPAGPVTAEAAPPPVLTAAAFNSGGDLRRPDPMMCWGGSFLADSSCTALICFTTAPFDQSLVTTCWKGRGEEVPTAIASVLLDVGLEETVWVRLAYLKFSKEEEGEVLLFGPFFGGGDGTVMAGPLFAAAAEVAT